MTIFSIFDYSSHVKKRKKISLQKLLANSMIKIFLDLKKKFDYI